MNSAIRFFTEETGILASMAIAVGTASEQACWMGGIVREDGTPVAADTLYDLASLTKLFTGLLVMRLHEEGRLSLDESVTEYAPMFTHLSEVKTGGILDFSAAVRTAGRVDSVSTREEAEQILFTAAPYDVGNGRHYSDINAMVLKYIIEAAGGDTYMNLLRRYILQPLGMTDTMAQVPEELKHRCPSYNGEHRLEKGRLTIRRNVQSGTVHDPKAALLQKGDDCAGHAGLFSTVGDMQKLCAAVLRCEVVSPASLRFMSRTRTGKQRPDGSYSQYLGCQCYVKHPDQYFSEIPVFGSEYALGLSGFTGNHLCIDPAKGFYEFYLGNRIMNRLTMLIPEDGKSYQDYGLEADGHGLFCTENGRPVYSSVNYVHLKDLHLHAVTERILRERNWLK